jgi:tetratricopeptide (TPR) repeat protein
MRGRRGEQRDWFDAALSAHTEPDALRLRLLNDAAVNAIEQTHARQARAWLGEADTLAARLGEPIERSRTLKLRCFMDQDEGHYDSAIALGEEAVAVARAAADMRSLAAALGALFYAYVETARDGDALRVRREALDLQRMLGDHRLVALALCDIADLSIRAGELDAAQTLLGDALALCQDLRDDEMTGNTRGLLGALALHRGDYDDATRELRAALRCDRELGLRRDAWEHLVLLAAAARGANDGTRADRLFAAAEAIAADSGLRSARPLAPAALLRPSASGPATRVNGRVMTFDETLAYALGEEP